MEAKRQRKDSTWEAALYPVIANLVSQHGNEITNARIWGSIRENIEGSPDQKKPNEYHTSEFGTIYRNTITNIICDKFGAKRKHKETGNVLIFNPQKVTRAGKVYNSRVSIQTKLIQDNPESTEGTDGSTKLTVKSVKSDDYKNTEISEKPNENIQDITQNITNILQKKGDRRISSSPGPSTPSERSDLMKQERIICRIGRTDTWACQSCILRGDRHFMKAHVCSEIRRKRVTQFDVMAI